jgi:hypothetical protein
LAAPPAASSFWAAQNSKACAKLNAAQTKMRANLARSSASAIPIPSRDNRAAKRRIQAALKANDCDGNRAAVQAAALKGKQDAERPNQAQPGLVAVLGNGDGDASNTSRARSSGRRAYRRRTQVAAAAATTAPCACAVATAFSSRSPRPPRHRISPVTSAPAR